MPAHPIFRAGVLDRFHEMTFYETGFKAAAPNYQ